MRSVFNRRGIRVLATLALLLVACDDKKKADSDKEKDKKTEEDKEEKAKADKKAASDKAQKACDAAAKACGAEGEKDVATGCKENIEMQIKAGCGAELVKAVGCFEKEICSGKEKVLEYNDFFVLSSRNSKCQSERQAMATCMTKDEEKGGSGKRGGDDEK